MMKRVIAVILATVIGMGGVGTVPTLAAETTVQETENVEEEAVDDTVERTAEAENAGTGVINDEATEEDSEEAGTEQELIEVTAESGTVEDIEEDSANLAGTSAEIAAEMEPPVIKEETMEAESKEVKLAEAGDVVDSGTCGENLTWEMIRGEKRYSDCYECTLIVSGTGPMTDWEIYRNQSPWTKYKRNSSIYVITELIVEEGVTTLGTDMLGGISSNGSTNNIHQDLSTVTLPSTLERIGAHAFTECGVSSVNLPNGLENIGDFAFCGCNLSDISLPDSITFIGKNAFSENDLNEVVIPKNMTTIGDKAFEDCKISDLTITDGVKSIGKNAFANSGLNEIHIPSSVTFISVDAFVDSDRYYDDLDSNNMIITVDEGNRVYDSRNNCNAIIETSTDTLVIGCDSTKIPDSVVSIGDYAFRYCRLNSLVIPESVNNIGDWAFAPCGNLTSIVIPDSVTSIGEDAFYGCEELERVVLPHNLVEIKDSTFGACDNLQSISIPKSIKTIGRSAFSCRWSSHTMITDVYYEGTEEEWDAIEIGETNEDLLDSVFHYQSYEWGEIIPNIYTGVYRFTNWDSENQDVYLDDWPYSFTDTANINPSDLLSMVGNYVYAEIDENKVQRLCVLEEHFGTIRDYSIYEKDGNAYASNIMIDNNRYTTISDSVYYWANFDEYPVGTKVAFYLVDGKIVLLEKLLFRKGRLDTRVIEGNTITIDGTEYQLSQSFEEPYTSDLAEWEGKKIGYYIGPAKGNTIGDEVIFEITGLVSETANIRLYSSSPDLELQVGESMDIVASLIIDDVIDNAWARPAFVTGDETVISLSEISSVSMGYECEITGLAEGTSSLTTTDSESGAHLTVTISVVPASSEAKNYSYKLEDIPAFYPDAICDHDQLTNFYDFNGLYVSNYKMEKTDGGTRVSFDVYNHNYMTGAIDVFDAEGNWIQSEAIKKYTDISSLYDTGKTLVYMVRDGVNLNLLSYTANTYSVKTSIEIIVPDGGYFTISNNFYSPGVYLYNCIDYLTYCTETMCDVVISGVDEISVYNKFQKALEGTDSITGEKIKEIFIKKMNSSLVKTIGITTTINIGDTMGVVTDDFEDILNGLGISWKELFKNSAGIGESIFEKMSGPPGVALKGLFSFNKLSSRLLQTISIGGSLNRSYISVHSHINTKTSQTVSGVKVSYEDGIIEDDTVLQVFRIGDPDDVWRISGVDYYPEQYTLYNISFVRNEENVQPNGMVTVRVPVPDNITGSSCAVYRQEADHTWTKLKARVDGSFLYFETDHFSLYMITEDDSSTEKLSVSISEEEYTYCGEEIIPAITVKNANDEVLTEGSDYSVTYENNLNVGTAKIIITGMGVYSETIEKDFRIIPKEITPSIMLSDDSFTYTGQSQKPMLVSVKDGDKALTDADFDITWPEECVNSGTYEVDVTLKGNYSGSGKAVFTINKAAQTVTAEPWLDELGVNLSTCCTVDGIGSITYTSSNPSVVTVDGYGWMTSLAEGTAIITVTANGDENHLSGQTTFEITVKSVYAVTSGPCGENATWTYYNNGTVEINGTGIIEPRKNSSGDYLWDSFYTDDPVWDYKKVDTVIINEGITGIGGEFFSERSSYGYGAMSDSPTTVIIADSVNTIYKWAFINCSKLERVYIGSGLMTLENCAFTYCPSLKDISVSENNNWFTTYDGALYSKDLKSLYKLPNNGRTEFSISQETVTIKEDALGDLEHLSKLKIPKSVKVIEDYALDGSNNLKDIYYEGSPAEWRKLTIGTHNTVLETANIHYAESDKSVEDCTLTLSTTSYVYDGNAKKPEVIIVDDTKTLEEGVDYQITFANNTDAGTATITITGIGSYIGTVERTFEITPQTITPTITLSQSSFTYNGKEQKPSVTVSYNGKQLKEGVDYNLAYDNNIEPGTASVTISCIGNYSGSATKEFTINKDNVLTGTWQKNSKGWWYSWSDGTYSKNKFESISGKTYYFNSSGYMVTGWQSIGGKWYYFNASGAMMTGWQSIGGKWYYMNSTGVMQTGLQNINGKTYYFSTGGAMATGWQKINNKWYYFSAGGSMVTGWQKNSNKWYYFEANGVMLTGWQSIGGKWYYFEGSGVMAANKWVGNYYLTGSGAMATNIWIGKYYVGADGKWIPNYKAAN